LRHLPKSSCEKVAKGNSRRHNFDWKLIGPRGSGNKMLRSKICKIVKLLLAMK
jgi:hypothetical protein